MQLQLTTTEALGKCKLTKLWNCGSQIAAVYNIVGNQKRCFVVVG